MPWGFPGGSVVKNLPANTIEKGDAGSIPGSEISPGGRNGSLLQYSCMKNFMDRGAWWTTVHRVSKSWTRLSMPALYNAIGTIEGNIWKLSFTSESFFSASIVITISILICTIKSFVKCMDILTHVHTHTHTHTHTHNTLCLSIFCSLTGEDDTRTTSVSH